MAASPDNDPRSRSLASSATHASATRSRPKVGAVPFAVWRLGDDAPDSAGASTGNTFNARLARRLVAVYTRRGDWVVDLAHDDELHAAAIGARRHYIAIAGGTRGATERPAGNAGPIGMVYLQWPHIGTTAWLATCRQLLAGDGCVLAVLTGEPDHERTLRSAAHEAGLIPVARILAIHSDEPSDRFSFYSDIAEAQQLDGGFTQVARSQECVVFRPAKATR
jgi:hypothetical protein